MTELEAMILEFKAKHPMGEKEFLIENEKKVSNLRNWPSIECPFFTDDEIEQLQGYYSPTPAHESYHDYFDENGIQAMNREKDNAAYKTYGDKVKQLQLQVQNAKDQEEADEFRQQLVDIGWNPEVDYNETTQEMAKQRFTKLTNYAENISIVDMRPIMEYLDTNGVLIEATNKPNKHAISVIMTRGKSAVSPIISKVTNSEYTHAGFVLDGEFDKIFTFSMVTNAKLLGGFSVEKISDYPKENRFAVYTIFVNDEDYSKMKAGILAFTNIKDKTTFNAFNLIFFPIKKIHIDSNKSMICSQFVETILRLGNIEFFSGIPSAKVSPDMLYRTLRTSPKVYITYDDTVGKFNVDKAKRAIDKLCKNAKLFKESALSKLFDTGVLEARWIKFPVKKDKNGDILITNPWPNLEREYQNSHRLLLEYDKAHNYDGMKYELARLFYMNYLIEKNLYHRKIVVNKEKNIKLRARILNDFHKYIKIVLEHEPSFNFAAYYENSQFYPYTIVVDKTVGEILNDILKNI